MSGKFTGGKKIWKSNLNAFLRKLFGQFFLTRGFLVSLTGYFVSIILCCLKVFIVECSLLFFSF